MITRDAALSANPVHVSRPQASARSYKAVLTRIAVFATLGMLSMPMTGHGQVRLPTREKTTRVIRPDSIPSRTQPPAPSGNRDDVGTFDAPPVMTIPRVIGMTVSAAIDTLRWTELRIVQLESITTRSRAGLVVSQRPRAGTPVRAARAETLFVAVAPRRPTRPPRCLLCPLIPLIVDAFDKDKKPPSPPPRDNPGGDSVKVPIDPPDEAGGSPDTVPGTDTQKRTKVPDLYLNTPTMVSAALERSHLNLTNLGTDYSDDVPRGRVFRQQPAAGKEVATSTYVAVWYSNGPHPPAPTFRVPRVVGLELAEAADSLRRSGFRAGHVTFLSRRGAEKKVVHQSPAEGEPAHRNDAVDLTITTPPSQVSVPSVIKLTREAARQRLEDVGLRVGRFTLVVLANRGTGIVSQTPRAGAEADSGTLVDLVENRPPEVRRVRVPDLSGKSVAASDSALQRDSLALGDVLRPGINAVDRVIDQRPQPGQAVFMHSPVTIALGASTGPPPETLIRLPGVVNLSVDSARRTLSDSGFTRLSIGGGGDRLTSASIVESQTPAGGTFVAPNTLISLVARSAPPLPVMPNLVGQSRQVARVAAELDSLRMILVSEIRSLRLDDEVVRQYPEARQPRRPDNTVDVFVEIPFIPPVAAAVLGLGVVAGVGGVGIKKWLKHKPDGPAPEPSPERPPERTVSEVTLETVTGEPSAPVLHAEGRGSLIRASFTLRFGMDSSPSTLEVPGDSLVKPKEGPDA